MCRESQQGYCFPLQSKRENHERASRYSKFTKDFEYTKISFVKYFKYDSPPMLTEKSFSTGSIVKKKILTFVCLVNYY